MRCNHIDYPNSRREFLLNAGGGFGALAFAALSGQSLLAAPPEPAANQISNRLGKAKNIIWLFMEGGPSHLDLFDRKPLVNELAGQTLPDSFPRPVTAMGEANPPETHSSTRDSRRVARTQHLLPGNLPGWPRSSPRGVG